MSDPKQNPIFKAIQIECMWETVLNVSYKWHAYSKNVEINKVSI